MDSTAKHRISSETSSDENGQPGKVNEGTGRYYECSYCKRGFTNAQALGGHMNIHRKDKAKAKKPSVETSVPQKSDERLMNRKHFGPISGYRYEAPGIQINCPMYFPASNPGHLIADSEFLGPRGEYFRANLSLQLGASFMEDDEEEKKKDEKWNRKGNDEVDLELRLGHKP